LSVIVSAFTSDDKLDLKHVLPSELDKETTDLNIKILESRIRSYYVLGPKVPHEKPGEEQSRSPPRARTVASSSPYLIAHTSVEKKERTSVRLPEAMIAEIDRIVTEIPELSYNRQHLVESAIREKLLELKTQSKAFRTKRREEQTEAPKQ
jgi:hypothetical protein